MGFSLGSLLGGGAGGGLGLGLGLLGGLFGGNKSYGSSRDLKVAQGLMGAQNGIADQYGNMAGAALGQYAGDDASARQATGQYADFLRQDPYTDSYSTAALAQATNGANEAYGRAGANLSHDLAARGLGGSSIAAGALTDLAARKAATFAGAQNSLALAKIGQRRSNLSALTGLLGGQAQNDYSRGLGALGSQQSVLNQLSGRYMNQGNAERGMEQNYQSGLGSALGGLASGYGSQLGEQDYLSQLRRRTQTGQNDDFLNWMNRTG